MNFQAHNAAIAILKIQGEFSNKLHDSGKQQGLHSLDDDSKRILARELYWKHGSDQVELMSFLDLHPDTIPDWFLWGEVEMPCRQCKDIIRLTFRDKEASGQSNLGSCLCRKCHFKACNESIQAEKLKAAAQEAAERDAKVVYLRSLPYEEYLKTEHWLWIREFALERDGHRCRFCNAADNLNVHHRTYERLGWEDPDDLTTLCYWCHQVFHENRRLCNSPAPPGSTADGETVNHET